MDLENIMQDTIVIEARARERKGKYESISLPVESDLGVGECSVARAGTRSN